MKYAPPKMRGGNVTRLTDWHKDTCLFENEEQIKGALKLANHQFLDGLGTDPKDWIGLTDAELDEWSRGTRQLPARLRTRKRSRKIALETLLRATITTLEDMLRDGRSGTSLPAASLTAWRDTLQSVFRGVVENGASRLP